MGQKFWNSLIPILCNSIRCPGTGVPELVFLHCTSHLVGTNQSIRLCTSHNRMSFPKITFQNEKIVLEILPVTSKLINLTHQRQYGTTDV
jgi:hypothetical protein